MAEHARALQEELGMEAAQYAMGGSKATSAANASRQYKGLVRKFNFSLKVEVSYHEFEENGNHVTMPYIKPSNMLACLLNHYPWLLLGGLHPGPAAQQLLLSFWKEYVRFHPSHAIFASSDSCSEDILRVTIPLLLHGDAGRTQKKQALEIMSFEGVLGLDSGLGVACKCRCGVPCEHGGGDYTSPYSQCLNHKNSSYLTRFLMFAFNSKKHGDTPGLLQSMLDLISADLGSVCRAGLRSGCTNWRVAILGMKGDLEYHQKTGLLNRSYLNVGSKNLIKCCHLCEAGGAEHAFEDVAESASWVGTMHSTVPWRQSPPFKHIPFEDWSDGKAAAWFRLDPFHVFRLGIARNFIASVLLLLSFKGFFDTPGDSQALDARLVRAWSFFQLFCLQAGTQPLGLRSFSRARLHYEKEGKFPYITGKGSDSVLILKFLRFFLELQLKDDDALEPANVRLLRLMLRGCIHGLLFTQSIHGHGIWLTDSCAREIRKSIQAFANDYARLAAMCIHERRTLFSMVPKAHSLLHFRTHLSLGLALGGPVLNVGLFDCSTNEDFVGKISRHSRRISNRHLEHGVIRAYLVKCKFVITKFRRKRSL